MIKVSVLAFAALPLTFAMTSFTKANAVDMREKPQRHDREYCQDRGDGDWLKDCGVQYPQDLGDKK